MICTFCKEKVIIPHHCVQMKVFFDMYRSIWPKPIYTTIPKNKKHLIIRTYGNV